MFQYPPLPLQNFFVGFICVPRHPFECHEISSHTAPKPHQPKMPLNHVFTARTRRMTKVMFSVCPPLEEEYLSPKVSGPRSFLAGTPVPAGRYPIPGWRVSKWQPGDTPAKTRLGYPPSRTGLPPPSWDRTAEQVLVSAESGMPRAVFYKRSFFFLFWFWN